MNIAIERSHVFGCTLVLVLGVLFVAELSSFEGASWLQPSLLFSAVVLSGLLLLEQRRAAALRRELENNVLHAEKALQAAKEKFVLVFRAIPDAVLITSLPEGEVLEVNAGFTQVCGYSREEALGRTVRDLGLWYDPEERAQILASVQQRGNLRDVEFRGRMKSGELRTCLLSLTQIQLEEKPALLTVVRDISALKRTQEAKDSLYNELMETNHELQRFTYTVSHDLKSPLFTIRGFLGLLEKDIESGDPQRVADDIERIQIAAESMERLLGDLLKLSRAGRIVDTVGVISTIVLVREAVEMLAGEIGERGVVLHFEEDMPTVVGDHQRLIQVFLNLIGNAVKFMGDQQSPQIWITAEQRGPFVECAVRDNGRGIDPQSHELIFGLFKHLDNEQQGTGIGLALAKRIVEVHGGQIRVESEGAGRGSAFLFTLPGEFSAGE